MSLTTLEPLKVALLLRELADEVVAAEGATRNGLFLELHRLLDTTFRLALEELPNAPSEVRSQAFSQVDSLPAPQVVRKLWEFESSLVTAEIRKSYKHMNAVRNNMAHKNVLERVVVSRSNSKRMAHVARLVANQLDPEQEMLPDAAQVPVPLRPLWHRNACYTALGALSSMLLSYAIFSPSSTPMMTMAAIIFVGMVVGTILMFDQ